MGAKQRCGTLIGSSGHAEMNVGRTVKIRYVRSKLLMMVEQNTAVPRVLDFVTKSGEFIQHQFSKVSMLILAKSPNAPRRIKEPTFP
jgi:hypothetical protein